MHSELHSNDAIDNTTLIIRIRFPLNRESQLPIYNVRFKQCFISRVVSLVPKHILLCLHGFPIIAW